MAKIKNIIVAHNAQPNPQMPMVIDIYGAFDNLIQPMFPLPIKNISVIITLEEILRPTTFEVRINSPEDELISKGEIIPVMDQYGVGKSILNIQDILLKDRGTYTIDIFEKNGNELKFLATSTLFIADYPLKRILTEQDIQNILNKGGDVIRTVKLDFKPHDNPDKLVKLQLSLDTKEPLQEGYEQFPNDNKLVIEGKEYDLTGIRRQIEWMYGNPIPKPSDNLEPAKD
ncbi:MAG: hypothetical protein ACRCSK_04415, partial [Fusobacteriaceae bacterium]